MDYSARMLVCWGVVLGAIVASPPASADDPRPTGATAGKSDAPVYIFLDPVTDLDSVRQRIDRPDYVILKGTAYDLLRAESRTKPLSRRAIVESLAITADVLDDLVHVRVDFGIATTGKEPEWVPIWLDRHIVTSARQGDRDLPVRVTASGGYEVELRGDGPHRIRVELASVVQPGKGAADLRRVEWSIPEAASTRLQAILAANTSEVATVGERGLREPLPAEPIEGAQRLRVSAYLTPRRVLELTWKTGAVPGAAGPALLGAQGEIALDVERGSLRARSTWDIRSTRGSVRQLELRIDPLDEIVAVECDGRPIAGKETRNSSTGLVTIPLAEPLTPDKACRLVVGTRRSLSPESTTRITYRGVPLENVVAQSGLIAISQSGTDPWVTGSAGRGLRPIDPRGELPSALRAKPSIVLAYQFIEQPFELGLQVDPSPPIARVESRTTIRIEPARARVDARLDYTVSRGRIFETRITLPPAMTLDNVGPEGVVSAYEVLAHKEGEPRVVVARLTSRASEDGKFSIYLSGREKLADGVRADVGLPRPLDAKPRGGLVAVVPARNVAVELVTTPGTDFREALEDPPASWPWPSGLDPATNPAALWLRHDEAPASLSLSVATRERLVRATTTLDARVDRRRVEVRQETNLLVQFGTLSRLELSVPEAAEGAWEVEGLDVARREPVGPARNGRIPFRLHLRREIADAARIRFRIVATIDPAVTLARPSRVVIPSISIVGADSPPILARVASGEGIELAGEDDGWTPSLEDPDNRGQATTIGRHLEQSGNGPFAINVTARATVMMPATVVSQLAMITTGDSQGARRTSATFHLENHEATLRVQLPTDAEWTRARIGRETIAEVERSSGATGYRIRLPADMPGPLSLTLEYVQPSNRTPARGWAFPRLEGDAVILETSWEIRMPAHLTVVGVPRDWSDANEWRWDRWRFRRRPVSNDSGPSASNPPAYRFSRVGGPSEMAPLIFPTAGIIGLFSGAVLGFGLLALHSRTWARASSIIAPAGVLAFVAASPPSILPLAAESSALGCVLLVLAAVTQVLVDRRRHRVAVAAAAAPTSSLRPVLEPSSDEPTVIRRRDGTTVDHAPEGVEAVVTG